VARRLLLCVDDLPLARPVQSDSGCPVVRGRVRGISVRGAGQGTASGGNGAVAGSAIGSAGSLSVGGSGNGASGSGLGSTSNGGSTAQGGGTRLDIAACAANSDCLIEPIACCSCFQGPVSDYIGINARYLDQYTAQRCGPNEGCGCPSRNDQTEGSYYIATFHAQRCVVVDLSATDITACHVASDCIQRLGTACCAGCGGLPVSLNASKQPDLSKLVCDDEPVACSACPSPGSGDRGTCVNGRCAVQPTLALKRIRALFELEQRALVASHGDTGHVCNGTGPINTCSRGCTDDLTHRVVAASNIPGNVSASGQVAAPTSALVFDSSSRRHHEVPFFYPVPIDGQSAPYCTRLRSGG
jgi:hypothetical protein